MDLRIRQLDPHTHEAAKIAAARLGQSLNAYVLAAVRAAVLRSGQRDPVIAAVLEGAKK